MSNIKNTFKYLARRIGYDIVRHSETCENPFQVLPFLVRDYLSRDSNFYFVQVGANDGVRSDNLRHLIVEHRLKGLLIEPLPDQFERLCHNYSGHSQLTFENCAVAHENGQQPLYRIKEDAPVPDWAHGLATFDISKLTVQQSKIPNILKYTDTITVPTLTMAALLEKHSIRRVTLLQVDVEGFDHEIIKLTFEAGCYPEIINYEACHLLPKERLACRRLLLQHSYSFIDVGMDTLAIRQSSLVPEA